MIDIVSDFLGQTYVAFELIVVCHNCTDATFSKVKEHQDKRLKVIEIKTKESGKAIALNEGLRLAEGEIIVQMDADNRVPPDFLGEMVKYFSDPSINAIQVKVSTKNAEFNLLTKYQQLEYEMFGISYWEGRNVLGQSCTIGGTGVAFRKSVLELVNGWDNELIEDYDLYCKLSKEGIKILYASDIQCFDEKPPYWAALVRQRARWIRGHFLVCKKRLFEGASLCDSVYMVSPFFYVAWYLCSVLTILYFIGQVLNFSVSYWYVPAHIWLVSLIFMYGFFIRRLVKQKMTKDIRYLPLYFLFSFHWLIAFLKSLTIKTWAQTKTEHGYTTT